LLFLTEAKVSVFSIPDFERLIDQIEKVHAGLEGDPKPYEEVLPKIDPVLFKRSPEGVASVYEHWTKLRSERGNKGLLRKYWKAPDPTNNDPKVTFRRCKDEKRNLRRNRKYDQDYLEKVF